jgi:hypothetical protein
MPGMLGWILGGYNGELQHSDRVFEARPGDAPKVRLAGCGVRDGPLGFWMAGYCARAQLAEQLCASLVIVPGIGAWASQPNFADRAAGSSGPCFPWLLSHMPACLPACLGHKNPKLK